MIPIKQDRKYTEGLFHGVWFTRGSGALEIGLTVKSEYVGMQAFKQGQLKVFVGDYRMMSRALDGMANELGGELKAGDPLFVYHNGELSHSIGLNC